MTDRLSLDPSTSEARRYTRLLIEASASSVPIPIRCSRVNKHKASEALGYLGETNHGPLFTSSWPTEPAPTGLADERGKVGPSAVRRRYGWDLEPGREGMFAAVTPPLGASDDHPPLFVRCPLHGDAVLDRADAAEHLRSGKTWFVQVGSRLDVVTDSTWLDGLGTPRRTTHTTRMGTPVPLEEAHRILDEWPGPPTQ